MEASETSGGAPTICLPLLDRPGAASETLADILLHTSAQVPVLLVGATARELEEVEIRFAAPEGGQREVSALAFGGGAGFAQLANVAAGATGRSDLVFVASGVRVGPMWLSRLKDAAHCDSTVVSATALGDDAGALSVIPKISSTPGERPTQPAAALAVISHSPRAYPRITCAGAHCVYLRRAVLDRLGGFDASISDPAEAMAEFSLRALALGMLHVVADDVYVMCPRGPQLAESAILEADLRDERTVLRRSLACARAALDGMSVTIDARALGHGVGGTQRYTVELILALAGSASLRLRVVVAPDLPDALARRFEEEPALEVITYEQAVTDAQPSDIVHRPQQVFTEDDLRLLHMLGERVVIGQQDLIAYRNPSYHASVDSWLGYRRATRLALAAADRVVFFSEHTMSDAVAEDLIGRDRGDVIGIGADLSVAQVEPAPVPGVPLDRDLLVCIGSDYGHKNRPFALALLEALHTRHGWDGCLVFAGSQVPHGSSRGEEQGLLAEHPGLVASVIDVGLVDEAQKAWLYERARAVVYPTLYEGFGLVPFEAAKSGAPCLFAPQASLVELAGQDAATLVPWDAQLSSDAVAALLVEGPERERHLRLLLDGVARAGWGGVVERLHAAYERAIASPQRAAAPRAWQELERERFITSLETVADDYQRAYHDLRANVGLGLPLVAEGGLLSRDEQRGLMRIASRRLPHSLMLRPIGLLGRLGVRKLDAAEQAPENDGGAVEDERNAGRGAGPRC